MLLTEKRINTDDYAGTVDIITGIDDFSSDIEFNEEWHTYKLNGNILPSVTQLLDDDTYANVDEDVLQYAKDKGTLVHKEIEEWLKEGKEGFTYELQEFKKIFDDNPDIFSSKAVYDIKTFATATKKNKEKTSRQLGMYIDGITYLTGETGFKKYLIHLPHKKPGKIIELE